MDLVPGENLGMTKILKAVSARLEALFQKTRDSARIAQSQQMKGSLQTFSEG